MRALNPSMIPDGDPDTPWRAFRSADDLLVVAAGGSGLYSMVLPSWGAGPHANPAVSMRIDHDQACAVPFGPRGG
jgi:hypothetical protein